MPGLEDVKILTGLTDPDAMLDFYLRLGCRVVVLKMGESGAFLGTPDMRVRVPPHTVRAVDATGAGDTFCGAFLARVLAGDTLPAAARYAGVAAALSVPGTARWDRSRDLPRSMRYCNDAVGLRAGECAFLRRAGLSIAPAAHSDLDLVGPR